MHYFGQHHQLSNYREREVSNKTLKEEFADGTRNLSEYFSAILRHVGSTKVSTVLVNSFSPSSTFIKCFHFFWSTTTIHSASFIVKVCDIRQQYHISMLNRKYYTCFIMEPVKGNVKQMNKSMKTHYSLIFHAFIGN